MSQMPMSGRLLASMKSTKWVLVVADYNGEGRPHTISRHAEVWFQ